MGIREIIERARRAQQENPQVHPVQLEIPEPEPDEDLWEAHKQERIEIMTNPVPSGEYALWASDEERMEHFRATTFERVLPPVARNVAVASPGARASSPSYGGLKSARNIEMTTEAIPGRPGWRVDSEGREWYSAAWL